MGLSQKSMPPCWSRRIVAQYICGYRARRIMRIYHAVSQGRNWTRSEQPDAANTEGTLTPAAHPAAPPAEAQADGAAVARGRQTCARSAGRAGGHSRSGREHPARKARDVVSMHAELGVRGAHPRRSDAAPSGVLRYAHPLQSESLTYTNESHMPYIT